MKSSIDVYNAAQKKAPIKQNELEARALIKTASLLNVIKENWEEKKDELDEALSMNRRLWAILTGNINDADNPLPVNIKQNVANLAYFIFKRTVDIMVNPTPQSLEVLININMNIARGLYENKSAETEEAPKQEDGEETPPPPSKPFNGTA
ncbi:MAG: flagellar biosynthesis regulator FlaF [Alphaproteobacteria bacterium]